MFIKRAFFVLKTALFFMPSVCVADPVQELAFSKEWLALGHYQNAFWGGYKSTPDNSEFFNAPDGQTNPEAELRATIDLFNSDKDDKKCYFPARYRFLLNHHINVKPFPKCPEYEKFKADLAPRGITLLYTDAYMNNPSSLFGHVLFRIDTRRQGTQLMAHGANYGAMVDRNANGLFFAVLGLTGGYMGSWTVKPYYDVINLYNNIENRDIWEFSLDLTDEELVFFIAHLWEIGQTQARYFFFSENCAYMLLELLDAVRPELGLAARFDKHVIPVSTVKVIAQKGLVSNEVYRPSRQSRIQSLYDDMSDTEKKVLLRLIFKDEYQPDDLTEQEQARVLQAAYEYFQYAYIKRDLDLTTYRRKSFFALKQQSVLPEFSFEVKQRKKSPIVAHDAARFSAAQGVRAGKPFFQVQMKPAYHTLTDSSVGLLSGAEINLLETAVRYYERDNRLVLQHFDIVSLRSLSPINALFQPVSYNVDTFILREENLRTHREGYVYNLTGGAGQTFALADHLSFFWFLNTHVKYGGALPVPGILGMGVQAGLYADWDACQLVLQTQKTAGTNAYINQWNTSVRLNKSVAQNVSLYADYTFESQYNRHQQSIKTGFNFYF